MAIFCEYQSEYENVTRKRVKWSDTKRCGGVCRVFRLRDSLVINCRLDSYNREDASE